MEEAERERWRGEGKGGIMGRYGGKETNERGKNERRGRERDVEPLRGWLSDGGGRDEMGKEETFGRKKVEEGERERWME